VCFIENVEVLFADCCDEVTVGVGEVCEEVAGVEVGEGDFGLEEGRS